MPLNRWFMAAGALAAACAATHSTGLGPKSTGVPIFEASLICYNGSELDVRVLVGARDGTIRLDRRFLEGATVDVGEVLDCTSGAPLGYLIEDLIELSPGQWVGRDQNFLLFSPPLTKERGPDCIRVRFVLQLVPMRPGGEATLELEVHRTGSTSTGSSPYGDGGTDAGQLDAGTLAEPSE